MKRLSVVVPVYNLKTYLGQCLDSLVAQTYGNLEIILVDDGSTDGSRDMIREYEKSHANIIAIYQDNHGESHARNTGLKVAAGDYITICDCDDWLEPDMYEVLMGAAEAFDADISAGGFFHIEKDVDQIIANEKPVKDGIINREEFLRYLYERDTYMAFAYMWSKVFKRELFFPEKGDEILFDENLEFGGDSLALCLIGLRAEKTVYTNRPLYHYRQRSDSGSHAPNLKKRCDWISAYIRMVEALEEAHISDETVKYLIRFLAYICGTTAEIAFDQNNKDVLVYAQSIMEKYEKIYIEMNRGKPERFKWFKDRMEYSLL